MIKNISKNYDENIKKECDDKRFKFIDCVKENYNKIPICDEIFNDFNNCIKTFDINFRKKVYSNYISK